jgi:hypothetical protein
MFQIKTPGVLNGCLVYPERVMMNMSNPYQDQLRTIVFTKNRQSFVEKQSSNRMKYKR